MEAQFSEGNVKLSAGVLDIGGKQYQVRQINTTEIVEKMRVGMALFSGFVMFVLVNAVASEKASVGIEIAIFGGVIVSVGVALLFKIHVLRLTMSSKEVSALSSGDKAFVTRVRDAIAAAQNGLANQVDRAS